MAEPVPRRSFLSLCTGALLALLGLALAVPAVCYVGAPLRRKRGESGLPFADAGPLSEIPAGRWLLRALETVQANGWTKGRVRHAVWVRREGTGDAFTVLSSLCPHLGCPIDWHPGEERFVCPCHGGAFSAAGERTAGPPPRRMDRLDYEVRNGRLWVRWQEFKIGVAEPTPVRT